MLCTDMNCQIMLSDKPICSKLLHSHIMNDNLTLAHRHSGFATLVPRGDACMANELLFMYIVFGGVCYSLLVSVKSEVECQSCVCV
jgi:hypothetical protein